jgi:hypothetical protein
MGKDTGGNWYQIAVPQGKDGLGWVSSQYVEVQDKGAIPVVGGRGDGRPSGVIIQQVNVRGGPGTDFDSLGTLNPADVVALTGKDSGGMWLQIQYASGPDGKGSPAVNPKFLPDGVGSVIYSSDVSAPEGDAGDWIGFTPYSTRVRASLACVGNGALKVEMLQNGAAVPNWGGLQCGMSKVLDLSGRQAYLLHIFAVPRTDSLGYVHFTLSIDGTP